jgi:hypothetical protein
LSAVLIIGMSVSAALLILRIPSFFSPEGGDPVTAGVLAFVFVVFAVGARLARSASAE